MDYTSLVLGAVTALEVFQLGLLFSVTARLGSVEQALRDRRVRLN